jgi:hypothetical protein
VAGIEGTSFQVNAINFTQTPCLADPSVASHNFLCAQFLLQGKLEANYSAQKQQSRTTLKVIANCEKHRIQLTPQTAPIFTAQTSQWAKILTRGITQSIRYKTKSLISTSWKVSCGLGGVGWGRGGG